MAMSRRPRCYGRHQLRRNPSRLCEGVFSQRGSHWKSLTEGGAQERQLADKYQKQAESIRAGWPLVAAVLQRLADGYASDAKREDERLHDR